MKDNSKKLLNDLFIKGLSIPEVLLIAFFFFLLWKFSKVEETDKVLKKELTSLYQVDKKTFNKWVQYFCSDIIPDYGAYLKQRKITKVDYHSIVTKLGHPNDYPILSKKQIIEQADGTYRSLRESIRAFPQQFGISIDVFSRLHKFPPKISKQISMQYN